MNYVIADIHNDYYKLEELLSRLSLKSSDRVFFLGDLFDRGGIHADPLRVYLFIRSIPCSTEFIMGNHDMWLADYIDEFLALDTDKRRFLEPYPYNTFHIISNKLSDKALFEFGAFIRSFSLQLEVSIRGNNYLLSHAMTSPTIRDIKFHTMGLEENASFFMNGIQGYISIIGHHYRTNMKQYGGTYRDKHNPSIWVNNKNNVMMIDSGCDYHYGRLGAICLETGEDYYA